MAAPQQEHRGWTVKQVNSGDTIVIKGKPRGGPPPEKTVILSNITAPKLGRRPIGNEEPIADEPFAWNSREYLRKLLIGKVIDFQSEYTIPNSGRECGLVFLLSGDNPVCVNELMVKEGWASIRTSNKSEGISKYEMLELEAKTAALGIHNELVRPTAVRNVTWVQENPRMLFDELKGQRIKGVVESVRDGGTLRVLLLPSFHYITVMLTGVRCPAIRPDEVPEEHAIEAKYAVESKLLNRDVELILEGTSGGGPGNNKNVNFVGTIVSPGNISVFLLREGLAKCVDWSMKLLSSSSDSYRNAVKQAKTEKKRLWKNYVGPASTVPKDQKEFSGKVTEVVNGETIIVKVGQVYKRITLSSIRQPRPVEGQDAGPPSRALYEVPYLFEAREFLRKRLIGKKVNVTVDYVRPPNNGYPERICASVFLGNQNLQEAIVSKGLATVAWHKQDDDERAANYDALLLAQEKAKKNKHGLHKIGEPPIHKVADLSGNAAKSKQFLPFLQRVGRLHAVIEFVASGSRFRVYIPRETCLATLLLSGITCPRAGRPATKSQPATEPEEYGNEALEFVKDQIMQREVEIEVENCDKAGNFIGYLFNDDKNMSVELVKEGLASVHSTAERGKYFEQLTRSEDEAQIARKNIWKNFVEKEEKKEEEVVDSNKTETLPNTEEVVITHLEDCTKFWVQKCSDGPNLISLMNQMRSDLLSNPPMPGAYSPRINDVCAAVFSEDQNWYRAKIVKIYKDTGLIDVLFVDYGNGATVSPAQVAKLAHQYTSMAPAAFQCQLAFLVSPTDEEWISACHNELRPYLSNKLVLTHITKSAIPQVALTSDGIDLATHLLSSGLVEYETQRNRFSALMSKYEASMNGAKKSRLNRFQYGDFTSDDAKEFGFSK